MNSFKKPMAAIIGAFIVSASLFAVPVNANAYREKGKTVTVAKSNLEVTPPQDWNKLSVSLGKNAETWTLDGEQLNDVTFYGGIAAGKPLLKERSKKREPLPKLSKTALLIDIPELLEGTYRAYKKIGVFETTSIEPKSFLGSEGVYFTYAYVDADNLTRKGEAHAALIGGKLFMATFDAPRLHYFDEGIDAYRALVATAAMP